MKKINYTLIIGMLILIIFAIMILFPYTFTSNDPFSVDIGGYQVSSGHDVFRYPPFPPSKNYPLGSDYIGRDLYSSIVYGTQITLKIVVAIAFYRFIIALIIGIPAGFGKISFKNIIKFFNNIFSTLPVVLIDIFTLAIFIKFSNNMYYIFNMTIIVLTITEWSKLAEVVNNKTEKILNLPFIKGEIAIGKTNTGIAFDNVLPHLLPSLVSIFALEISRVMLLLLELAVLGFTIVPFANIAIEEVQNGSNNIMPQLFAVQMAYMPEWTNLIILGMKNYIMKPWIMIYPLIAMSLSVIGFNLFGEGIAYEIDRKDSRLISYIKKIIEYFAPRVIKDDIRLFKNNPRPLIIKTVIPAIILLLIFVRFPAKSMYAFNINETENMLSLLTSKEYKGRFTEYPEMRDLRKIIAEKFKEYGVKPYGNGYFQQFELGDIYTIDNAEFMIDGKPLLKWHNDFYIKSIYGFNIKGKLTYVTDKIDENSIILLNSAIDKKTLEKIKLSKAMIYVANNSKEDLKSFSKKFFYNGIGTTLNRSVNIVVTEKAYKTLQENIGKEVAIKSELKNYANVKGENIIGMIPGKDHSRAIIIGANYDGLGINKNYSGAVNNASSVSVIMEIAKVIGQSGKLPAVDIVFALWDGTSSFGELDGSAHFLFNYNNNKEKDIFYIDIEGLGYKKCRNLIIDTSGVKIIDKEHSDYVKILRKLAGNKSLYGNMTYYPFKHMKNNNIPSIAISSYGSDEVLGLQDDNMSMIDMNLLKNQGQFVLDFVAKIAFRGDSIAKN